MKYSIIATLLIALGFALPANTALGAGEWINDQEGCYCGTYPSGSAPVVFVSKGSGSVAERQATLDQMNYWNQYADIVLPSLGTGSGSPANATNEVSTFITKAKTASEYGINMDDDTYGITVIFPGDNFGDFDDCRYFYTNPSGCDDFTQTDVLINADFPNGWTTDPNDYSGPALVQTTALHELGHTWGAHHVFSLPDFGDSFSTMNYINDDSGRFVTRMDAKTIRAAYPDRAQTVTDVGIFPFIFGNNMYAETYTSVSSATVTRGEQITISNYLIQNIGTTVADNTVVSFYLSDDMTITSDDILVGTADFGNLSVDADSDQSVTLAIPASTTEGHYYIGALVTVDGSEDDIAINNRFIIGRPSRTVVSVMDCQVQDGGFEDGSPNSYWTETSTNFSTPLCSVTECSGGTPYSGTWFAWFGGINVEESGSLEQSVTISNGSRFLNFYLAIPGAATTGFLNVLMDGTELFEVTQAHRKKYATYKAVSVDIAAYADDSSHTLRFESTTQAGGGSLNFLVDDICLSATASARNDSENSGSDDGGGGCFLASSKK